MTLFNSIFKEPTFIKSRSKEIWIGWTSSFAEAYNMAIYNFMAPLLARHLFPQPTEWKAFFFSYSLVLIAACFFYPAGAFYYGYLGDRQGRQKTCIYSTLGLSVATGMMALVPFQFLGNNAWICILILVCAQHFFSGGEYHGSVIFSLEHAGNQQNGLVSSLSCLFAVFGLISANGLATLALLNDNLLLVRMSFLIGAVGGAMSYYLKNHCQETPVFISLSKDLFNKMSWLSFIRYQVRKIGIAVMVFAFFIVSYTFLFVFLPLAHWNKSSSFDTLKSLIAYGSFLVIAGLLADRASIRKVMLTGICAFSIAVLPLCSICSDLWVLQFPLTLCACLAIGPIHSCMLNQFEVQNRCRGIFVSSAIATSVFGGSTVPICLIILEKTGSLAMCAIYPFMIALGALACLLIKPLGTCK
ncbi:MAG: MFS transporter [Verrucomicrobia bacterium]|nr:MFS transporter [Verrucomicrobiota bacterium]